MSESDRPDINLNLNVRGLPLSATLAINELSNSLRQQGKRIYKLGLGQSPFPVPQSVVDELKNNAHQKDYLPVRGLPALQDAVCEYYQKSQGLTFQPKNILIGPGSKELMFLIQLVYYGDLVIPTPSWVSYAPQAHIVGHHVRWLNTLEENDWLLMPEELENLCKEDPNKPRLIILNYPNNPTGGTYTVDQLKHLAEVARKYKVVMLSDEIYGETNHKGDHVSIAKFYPEGTVVSSGLSKWCGAGGWRLGTFAFPESLEWLLSSMASVASETFTSTSAPIQYAAVRAFKLGIDIERYLWNSRKILRQLGGLMYKILTQADVCVAEPKGGFYMFPNFENYREILKGKQISNSEQLCQRLLNDIGVAILPGTAFGRPLNELTARLSYVDFDGAKALSALETKPKDYEPDEEFIRQYCGNNIEAMEKTVEWLKS
ncbi:MAG: aspartate aminotransferase [Denitrovibrio sp.]|nr:MAG: aspartate aminotransferase [Denitrovibrio sp.]